MKILLPLSPQEAEMVNFMLEQARNAFANNSAMQKAWKISNTDLARVHRARKRLVKQITKPNEEAIDQTEFAYFCMGDLPPIADPEEAFDLYLAAKEKPCILHNYDRTGQCFKCGHKIDNDDTQGK